MKTNIERDLFWKFTPYLIHVLHNQVFLLVPQTEIINTFCVLSMAKAKKKTKYLKVKILYKMLLNTKLPGTALDSYQFLTVSISSPLYFRPKHP